jgi:molybdate transport repressor ModE-like protein
MINWDDLKYLACLAETGSLSAAARRLEVEHATVGRRIAALEAAIGTRLVDRRGGRYVLTDAGARAVAEAQRMEQAAVAVERIGLASEAAATIEVSVTTPPAIATELVVPRLPGFLAANPRIRLQLLAQSRNLSLTRGEADIAIRLTRPDLKTLIVRRLGQLPYGLFSAPGYLSKIEESERSFIGFESDMAELPQQIWLERLAGARPFAFRSNDLALQCAAVRAGMGIAALPLFLGRGGGMERVFPDQRVGRDIWLTYHEDLRSSPQLAAVAQFLTECLRDAIA